MTMPRILKEEIGSARYHELLRQEADFWDRTSRGEISNDVATNRDAELANITNGDLLNRALELTAARGRRVLELGCAAGGLSIRLARQGCIVDGVDIAPGRIQQGQTLINRLRSVENWAGDAQLRVGDLNCLEATPGAYDVVFAASVLHHILDYEHLLDVIYDALKPGGTLICLDHMESSLAGRLLRYFWLTVLPTEVPYWYKPIHAFNRLMARFYRSWPQRTTPTAFKLPERSPFEDISGSEIITAIGARFSVETYETHLLFADIVAGHLRMGQARNLRTARWLRRLDDWLIKHLKMRGETYSLVARKTEQNAA